MMNKPVKTYDRLTTISLLQGLDLIAAGLEKNGPKFIMFFGQKVNIRNYKLECFYKKGVKCFQDNCSITGSFFAIERKLNSNSAKEENYSLHLYGYDLFNNEMILTIDHIKPKFFGGKTNFANLQPMCGYHNWKKGGKDGGLASQVKDLIRKDILNHGKTLAIIYNGSRGALITRISEFTKKTLIFSRYEVLSFEFIRDLIFEHAGFLCTEIHYIPKNYVNSSTNHPEFRYDLYFLMGRKLATNEDINQIMRKIEIELRKDPLIYMEDTHLLKI